MGEEYSNVKEGESGESGVSLIIFTGGYKTIVFVN